MNFKSAIKKAFTTPMSAAGAFRASRRFLGGRVVVLCYHRVIDGPLDGFQPGMVVSREIFRRHMEWLARHFDVIDLVDFVRAHLTGERPDRPTAIVTFDDGWLDNYEVAFPILKSLGLPATIYLPTRFVGTGQAYWNARAEQAIARIHRRREILLRAFPDEHMPPEAAFLMELIRRDPPLATKIDQIIERTKIMPPDRIDAMTAFLEMLADTGEPPARTIVDWDEVMEMDRGGISFGSHSVNHRIMTQLSAAECFDEASQSMDEMTRRMGKTPLTFAYPNGDHNEIAMREVRRAGYLCAMGIVGGFADKTDELFSIPRYSIHEGGAPSEAALDFLLSGFVSA
ncbi:polysaccharide deacetylase family protein [bacterium]|nr:polysaccharide deacetylase family protein [bacterium]